MSGISTRKAVLKQRYIFVLLMVLLTGSGQVLSQEIYLFEDKEICSSEKVLCIHGTLAQNTQSKAFVFKGRVLYSKQSGEAVINLKSQGKPGEQNASNYKIGIRFKVIAGEKYPIHVAYDNVTRFLPDREWEYMGLVLTPQS